MKILHVFDTAGVASLLAKEQRKLGHTSIVINMKKYDPYNITSFYNNHIYEGNKIGFVIHLIKHLQKNKYDIVHIHFLWKLALPIWLLKRDAPNSKMIMHFHGTDARHNYGILGNIFRSLSLSIIDHTIVATKDLLEQYPNAFYIPNPVDIDHFTYKLYDHEESTKENTNAYHYMPYRLSRLDTYHDKLKFIGQNVLSKTALEALALGLTVIDCTGKEHKGLAPEHYPENVNKMVMRLYEH